MKNIYALIALLSIYSSVFSQAPTIASFNPASGPVGTLVTLTGTNLSPSVVLTIGGVSAIVVSNSGTSLVGMVMPGATTGAVSLTTGAGAVTANGQFAITPTPYPSAQQGSKLVGTDVPFIAAQGLSVSLSADGSTAIVGGPSDSSDAGAAWVYTRSGGSWIQQGAKLVGTGAFSSGSQGHSVSLSADGNTAIVGGDGDSSNTGAAWIYTRTGGVWTQQGNKLVGTGTSYSLSGGALQGASVSISADGNTAIVGGPQDDNNIGAVWIFIRTGTTWTQQGPKLIGTGVAGSFSEQGSCVYLSADGNTAIVGGRADNGQAGAAWVYTRSGSTWTQQGSKLVGTGATGTTSEQGYAVALSADGNTAISGGPFDNSLAGAVWIFTRSSGTWTQQGSKLTGTGAAGHAELGSSVSLSADGNTAIVGATNDSSGAGASWVFTRSGTSWTQRGSKLIGTGAINGSPGAYQGVSVSLSADGSTAIIGGDGDHSSIGAAWVFVAAGNTGISDISDASAVRLYPNPNRGSFTLQTSDRIRSEYMICDMMGRVVARHAIENDHQIIELPDAAEGVYILNVEGEQIRFVVMR